MVQKEVKKKTARLRNRCSTLSNSACDIDLQLSAAAPMIFPPDQTPFVAGMKTFSSLDELKTYLTTHFQRGTTVIVEDL